MSNWLRSVFTPASDPGNRIPTAESTDFWLSHFAWPARQPLRTRPCAWIPSAEIAKILRQAALREAKGER